jgi:hypothetical protein
MIAAYLIAVSGLAIIGVVLLARWLDSRSWRRSLVAYKLQFPSSLKMEDVAGWIGSISATTHAPSWSLLTMPPVVLEHVASHSGITHYLLIAKSAEATILSGLRANLVGIRLTEAPDYAATRPTFAAAAEARMTSHSRPLGIDRAEATSRGLLAALQPLTGSEAIVYQVIWTSAGTPRPVHAASPKPEDRWWAGYLEGDVTRDAEAVRALRLKDGEPLVRTIIRIGVRADSRKRALRLFGRVWPHLHTMNAPGVRVVRRWLPGGLVGDRMRKWSLPVLLQWPLTLNALEAAGLSAIPTSGVHSQGLTTSGARQLPPSPSMPSHGTVVGHSNWPGLTNRPLALAVADRLRHALVLGPTGTGKSTLMVNMALQDIAAGYGTVVIDPKSDMITDISARIGEERVADVIVLDPSATSHPIGLNILRTGQDEHARERAADNIVHVFAEVWKSSFGPRTADVLRNGILALTHTRAPDGSMFTIVELVELLTASAFRRYVLSQSGVPDSVRPFFQWFDAISEGERASVIGPSLNKLRALTTRSSLRLILGQPDGIDIGEVFRSRKILLVPLSKGTVGTETANLLGALIVSALWETALTRMAIPQEARRAVFAYIDEASDVVRLPVALADMLSQARGLGLSMTMATQYLSQLPEGIKAALLGTARTSIVFQADYKDAHELEPRFAPLTADDLMGLSAFEMAMKPSVGGQTLGPVTASTPPLGGALRDGTALAEYSRSHYGQNRDVVEQAMRRRIEVATQSGRLGREPLGDRP